MYGRSITRAENRFGVGHDAMTILKTAAEISNASGGAFNIAVGPVINLWKFTSGEAKVPDAESLKAAVSTADYTKIRLNGDTVTVPAGMEIDLGGIAKGHIADRIADFLRERGILSAVLNFGGNVVTIGSKTDGTPWMVGLQYPFGEHGKKCWAAVPCSDESVVTSGIYERGFHADGVWYHHIVDPRTGWPVQNGVECVTVCAKDSLLADGLTTALFVLGPEEGMKLAERFHVPGGVFGAGDEDNLYCGVTICDSGSFQRSDNRKLKRPAGSEINNL